MSRPFKLVSREFHPQNTTIQIGDVTIGGSDPVFMVGPCSVESEEQIFTTANFLKELGVRILRGGAFKPRTSPYSFQGLQERALYLLDKVRQQTGMLVISEVMDASHLDLVLHHVDILQIGARNMQNFHLLKEVGKANKPVMLKRGNSATIDEWMLAAEYIMYEGNTQVVLCERGIRSIETYTRNTLDLNAVPVVKDLSHLPIIVDPSHGVGVSKYIPAMAKAALAAGADGLIIEVHPDPENALSDGQQSLNFDQFKILYEELGRHEILVT